MGVRSLAQVHLVNSRRSSRRGDGLVGGAIVVLGLVLIWAAPIVMAVYDPPLMLEFINAGELER